MVNEDPKLIIANDCKTDVDLTKPGINDLKFELGLKVKLI